ncbi:MAG: LptF/LptG family permease [Sedimentisphaerales bacterium]|nr:LptF/LptG family permease [Sedimentisphaerales bacterium]
MKILDRYIAKNFMIGYAISFLVLIGLRIIIDLFVQLDEFAKHADLGTGTVLRNIVTYYGLQTTLYFRDVTGVITVVAAAFSLGKMARANELVAMIASGVSAKRIVGPILVLAIFFTGLAVADQELLIPRISDKLVRSHGDIPGQESYAVWFIPDGNGSLICSRQYDVGTSTFHQPTIITREPVPDQPGILRVTGRISAEAMTYNEQTGQWDLVNGQFASAETDSWEEPRPQASYQAADLLPKDIPVRQKSKFKSLLSSRQLSALAAQKTGIKDRAQLLSQRHFRITDPLINLTMLMVSLPVLICRDPKAMKSAILVSFILTAACFVFTFVCKMLATEVTIADRVMPELWAWLPVFIFLPIAFIELDSMRT